MGRPTLLTPDVCERIVAAVQAGASREGAAKCVGIDRSTLTEWLKRGREAVEGDDLYVRFVAKIREAEGAGEVEAVGHLRAQSFEGKTAATVKWLARLNPEVWSDKATITHDIRDDAGTNDVNDLDFARSVVAALESRAKLDET